jgi:hypothetical protein
MKAIVTHSLVALSVFLCITPSSALTRQAAGIETQERKVRTLGSSNEHTVSATSCTANGFCFFNDGINSWCVVP